MHQLMTLAAIVVMKVTTLVAVTGAVDGALLRCLPPTPSMMMKVIAFGIHAALSQMWMTR